MRKDLYKKSEQYYGFFEKQKKSILWDEQGKNDDDGEDYEQINYQRQRRRRKHNNKILPQDNTDRYSSRNKIYIAFIILCMILWVSFSGQSLVERLRAFVNFYPSDTQETLQIVENLCKKGDKIIEIKDHHQLQQPYSRIQEQTPYSNLPICLLVSQNQHYSLSQIKKSILNQNYTNSQTVYLQRPWEQKFISEQIFEVEKGGKKYTQHIRVFGEKIQVADEGFTYFFYKKIINKYCADRSVILFVNSPLNQKALYNINHIHQSYSAWIIYSSNERKNQIFSFYRRVFDLIEINDFEQTNSQYFERQDPEWLALSLFELSQQHKRKIKIDSVFIDPSHLSRIHVGSQKCVQSNRLPYQRLKSLSQTSQTQIRWINFQFNQFVKNSKMKEYGQYTPIKGSKISQKRAYQSIQAQQLLYLPKQHALAKRQNNDYDNRYGINKIQDQKQVQFCVTIISHNNVKNHGYEKSLQSLFNQQYKNFHIVFIDDNSNDGTFEKSKKFIKEKQFPSDRITFVKNFQRKYQAYNIVHAAYSYCHQDDIQIYIDGKDILIGNHVFSLLNKIYQKNDIWMSYSSSMTDLFTYGPSREINQELNLQNGNRILGKKMGPLMSWRVNLLKKIPIPYHHLKNGQWIDAMYEDALQHAFYELSGPHKIKYIPEILYLSAIRDNFNNSISSQLKQKIKNALIDIQSFSMLHQISSLDGSYQDNDKQFIQIFKKDWGVVFQDNWEFSEQL